MKKEFYGILEINEDASQEEIRKAYYKLAQKWHPDKNLNSKEEAEKKFKEIGEAYGVLSNEQLRKRYDAGETNFFDSEQEKSFWEVREKKLAEEIRIMEELTKTEEERKETMEKIWLLDAEYLERWTIKNDINNAFFTTYPRVFKEDLDGRLWEPYQDWLDKVWKMPIEFKRKEREQSEELKRFKEEMIKVIKEAEIKKQDQKRVRKDDKKIKVNEMVKLEKESAIEEIKRELSKRKIKDEDLREWEYSDYRTLINKLNKTSEIWELKIKIKDSIKSTFPYQKNETPKKLSEWLIASKISEKEYNILESDVEDKEYSLEEVKELLLVEEWKNISLDFKKKTYLINSWMDKGFNSQQAAEWINIGLRPEEAELAQWLVKVKRGNYAQSEWILNNSNLDKLRQEYQQYQINPPKSLWINPWTYVISGVILIVLLLSWWKYKKEAIKLCKKIIHANKSRSRKLLIK